MMFLLLVVFFGLNSLFADQNFFFNLDFQKTAHVKDESLYIASEKNLEKFWANCSQEIDWFEQSKTVISGEPPFVKWFSEGVLNVSYNCLDRHVLRGHGEKIALISMNERGETRNFTYLELLDEVSRVANLLKNRGIKKGECVAIYMPMVPESIACMLACARIGAIHLVIFGGMGPQAVKDRLLESQAKVLLTVDGCWRAGMAVAYKSMIDPILEPVQNLLNRQSLGIRFA